MILFISAFPKLLPTKCFWILHNADPHTKEYSPKYLKFFQNLTGHINRYTLRIHNILTENVCITVCSPNLKFDFQNKTTYCEKCYVSR